MYVCFNAYVLYEDDWANKAHGHALWQNKRINESKKWRSYIFNGIQFRKHMLLKRKLAGFANKYSQKENGEHLYENVR